MGENGIGKRSVKEILPFFNPTMFQYPKPGMDISFFRCLGQQGGLSYSLLFQMSGTAGRFELFSTFTDVWDSREV